MSNATETAVKVNFSICSYRGSRIQSLGDWNKEETINVSEEIGDAYPKDPIITICGSKTTILNVINGVKY
jgi:hypothetical protein